MGSYQEDCIERKSVRAGIIEQKPLKTRNGRPRPFIVEHRPNASDVVSRLSAAKSREWRRWGAYRTAEEAERAMQTLSRKYYFYEWRQKPLDAMPPPSPDNAQKE